MKHKQTKNGRTHTLTLTHEEFLDLVAICAHVAGSDLAYDVLDAGCCQIDLNRIEVEKKGLRYRQCLVEPEDEDCPLAEYA
jgi:hypothetical protein